MKTLESQHDLNCKSFHCSPDVMSISVKRLHLPHPSLPPSYKEQKKTYLFKVKTEYFL